MRIGKKSFAALAAASMLIAPVAAQAAPTAKAKSTASVKRTGADRKAENKIEGTAAILAALAAAAIIAGIVIASDSKDNSPSSP
jgi:hypothetical protein